MLSHMLRAARKTPVYVSGQLASNAGNASIAVTAPSNITEGNLLVAIVNANAGARTLTPPSGWTSSQLAPNRWTLYKTATASESASYTFTFDATTTTTTVTILNYSGGAIDVIGTASAAGIDQPAPSITVSQDSSIVVLAVTANTQANSVVTPSGWTKLQEKTTSSSQVTFDKSFQAGATGNIAQDGTATAARAALLSIKPR